MIRRLLVASLGCTAAAILLSGCGGSHIGREVVASTPTVTTAPAYTGIHKIRHVIVIMQENRSFDSYFGTYPGADGIPMQNGVPTVCVPNPQAGGCTRPYHDRNDRNTGGPHSEGAAKADIAGGRMDGFIGQQQHGISGCEQTFNPACGSGGWKC